MLAQQTPDTPIPPATESVRSASRTTEDRTNPQSLIAEPPNPANQVMHNRADANRGGHLD